MPSMSRSGLQLLGVVATGVAGLLVACSGSDSVAPPSVAYVRLLNTWPQAQAIDLLVNGEGAVLALSSGSLSAAVAADTGVQAIAVRHAGDVLHPPATISVRLIAGDTTTILTLDSAGAIRPWALADTGAVVASGKSKLRVVNFVPGGGVLFYASNPDAPALAAVMYPFPYGTASPYLEATAGSWMIDVATEQYDSTGHPMQIDTLFTTGALPIAAGLSHTLVFIAAPPTGYKVTVLTP